MYIYNMTLYPYRDHGTISRVASGCLNCRASFSSCPPRRGKQCHLQHPPVITIFVGGMFTIPRHGWLMTVFYPHELVMKNVCLVYTCKFCQFTLNIDK